MNRPLAEINSSDGTNGTLNKESLEYYIVTVGMNSLVSVLIIVTNCLLLLTLLTTKKLRNRPNAYIASLSVADLLVGLGLITRNLGLLPSTVWILDNSEFMCILMPCILYVSGTQSITSLVLVSFDRYIYIIHPFWYQRNISQRAVGIAIFVSWLFSISFGLLPFWINDFTEKTKCDVLIIVKTQYFIAQDVFFFAAAITISIVYGLIYRVVRCQQCKLRIQISVVQSVPRIKGPSRWRFIRFLILVCILFLLLWAPLEIVILYYMSVDDMVSNDMITITATLASLNSACNFFVFIGMNKDFRGALVAMILRRRLSNTGTTDGPRSDYQPPRVSLAVEGADSGAYSHRDS